MTNEAGLSVTCDLSELPRNDRLIAFNLFDPSVV